MGVKWFIDAWAIVDGYAFASRRAPDSIDATQTMFMAAPDFQLVPVARISTALRATRGPFQSRFHDEEGDEIGFDSLEQIVDIVRRGFLAGGLEPEPGGGAPLPTSPNNPGGGYEPIGLLEQRGHLGPEMVESLLAGEPRKAFLDGARELKSENCREPLSRFASGVLGQIERDSERSDDARASRFPIAIVALLGLADPEQIERCWELTHDRFASARRDLIRMPLPYVHAWSSDVRNVNHKLLLGLSSPRYFSLDQNDPMPLLFAALLVVGYVRLRRQAPMDLPSALRDACTWLVKNVAQVKTPDAAERALYDFMWRRIAKAESSIQAPDSGAGPEPGTAAPAT